MRRHRTTRQPFARAARRHQVSRVEQQQNLGRLATRRALGQTHLLNRVHCRWLRCFGHQQYFIAVTDATLRPRPRCHLRQQQDEVVLGFDRIEGQGDVPVRMRAGAQCDARLA